MTPYSHVLIEEKKEPKAKYFVQWRHQLWGTGARAPPPMPLELVQVVIFTLHVCSVAFPVHVKLVTRLSVTYTF